MNSMLRDKGVHIAAFNFFFIKKKTLFLNKWFKQQCQN